MLEQFLPTRLTLSTHTQVSVLLGNWQQVLNYYSKADASMEPIDVSLSLAEIEL